MITIREAEPADAAAIREIFLSCYQHDYPHQEFYDVRQITKLIFSDETVMLVADDSESGQTIGTASVMLEVGAYADLVGEFGRLAVRPEARHLGAGKLLMEERLRRVRDRLHVGVVDGRVAHPYTQKIAESHGFAVVGFAPLRDQFSHRESLALMMQHFGPALELRRNHPRIIPEVFPLAYLAMENLELPLDVIVDEESAPYPHDAEFEIEELSAEGYAPLLRIPRGRVRNREIFGPLRLHYGFFKLRAEKTTYLLARRDGCLVGAVGLIHDPHDQLVRIFELIALNDDVIRFLLTEVDRQCRETWQAVFVEIDVSAFAPRMQRTLLELGFMPIAYLPALNFQEVERLDVVRMARIHLNMVLEDVHLSPRTQAMADVVMRGLATRCVLPRIAATVHQVPLFQGLAEEQVQRLAAACTLRTFAMETPIFRGGDSAEELLILLSGSAQILTGANQKPVGTVGTGECLGEIAVLNRSAHSATAIAMSAVEAAAISTADLADLVRRRPDIGVVLYRNLAVGLGEKLQRTDEASAGPA